MGAETYCFICSGPFESPEEVSQKEVIKSLKKCVKHLKNKLTTKKYKELLNHTRWIKKFIGYLLDKKLITKEYGDKLFESKYIINKEKYGWSNDLIFLHKSNKNITNVVTEYSYEREFKDSDGNIYNASWEYDYFYNLKFDKKYFDPCLKYFKGDGYICHHDCYKVLAKKYGKFTFDDLYFRKINYGVMAKYRWQDVPWLLYFIDGNEYLLESPLKNKKHKSKILKTKYPIKDPNRKRRPSPTCSATLYYYGTKKMGNDGNTWHVVKTKTGVKRWKKI